MKPLMILLPTIGAISRKKQHAGCKPLLPRGCRPVLGFLCAWIVLATVVPQASAQAPDWLRESREIAKIEARQHVAAIQAAQGDVMGAKMTIAQIDEDRESGPARVTAVRCFNGRAYYRELSDDAALPDCLPCGYCGSFVAVEGPIAVGYLEFRPERSRRSAGPNRVPAQVPAGLPSNYLAPDPRHGPVVNFVDETDAFGTRVTSRTYADGHLAIDTPR